MLLLQIISENTFVTCCHKCSIFGYVATSIDHFNILYFSILNLMSAIVTNGRFN